MSHVVSLELVIKDLDALKAACTELGLEFREGQKTYRWYGRSVGDYPLPEGFKAADLGKCEHAIGIPDDSRAYEVGVVRRRDGQDGYTLLLDFWAGGYGIVDKVGGKACETLTQLYSTHVATKQARRMGFTVQRKTLDNGKIQLVCAKA